MVEIFRCGLTSAKANGKLSPLPFANAKIITVKLATKEENVHFTRSYRKCMATGLMSAVCVLCRGHYSRNGIIVLLTKGWNSYSGIIRNVFLFRNRVNRTHPKYISTACLFGNRVKKFDNISSAPFCPLDPSECVGRSVAVFRFGPHSARLKIPNKKEIHLNTSHKQCSYNLVPRTPRDFRPANQKERSLWERN